MSDLQLGTDGDLAVENGVIPLVTGKEAIAQKLGIHFRSFKGEWYQDEDTGFPWFEDVLGKGRTQQALDSLMRKHALGCPGVTSVDNLTVDVDAATRTLSVAGTVQTTDGPVDFSTELHL